MFVDPSDPVGLPELTVILKPYWQKKIANSLSAAAHLLQINCSYWVFK